LSKQTSNTIFMVKPTSFAFNEETARTNTFQNKLTGSIVQHKAAALSEFQVFVQQLQLNGITVHVLEDLEYPPKPDAVFPNNWISVHANGTMVLYPMCTPNRRLERNPKHIESIKKRCKITHIIDLSNHEQENRFLEGTGSIVFDHVNKKAYACISPRTDQGLFEALMKELGYEAISFCASDNGTAIYHTNVLMSIGDGFAVVCLDAIEDEEERNLVETNLMNSNLEIIEITIEQMRQFAGNMLALHNSKGQILVLSQTAFDSLLPSQIQQLEKYAPLVAQQIPTIETIGGGSARCMIAELFA